MSTSSGRSVRRSITAVSIPSAESVSAAASASCTLFIAVAIVRSVPSRTTAARPSRIGSPFVSPFSE